MPRVFFFYALYNILVILHIYVNVIARLDRCEDIVADDSKNRSKLFLSAPNQPLDQAPFLRVIDSGDAAAQQVASIVLALLIVVSEAPW